MSPSKSAINLFKKKKNSQNVTYKINLSDGSLRNSLSVKDLTRSVIQDSKPSHALQEFKPKKLRSAVSFLNKKVVL